MTIGELMDELAKYPRHLGVDVSLSHVLTGNNAHRMELSECDALPLESVHFEGTHVRLESK